MGEGESDQTAGPRGGREEIAGELKHVVVEVNQGGVGLIDVSHSQ